MPLKKLQEKQSELSQQYPDKVIEIWAEDEARMGLKPILRRIWALKGQRPIAIQKRAYECLHAYAFVQPDSGRSEFWIASHVDTVTMNVILQQFTQTVNPDQKKLILLLWDNAGWHRAKDLEVPSDIITVIASQVRED